MPINANRITALPARRTNSRCRFHETVHPRLSANLGRRGGVGKTKRGKSLKGINLLSQEKKEEKKLHPRKRLSPSHPPFCRPWLEAEKRLFVSLFPPFKSRKEREREREREHNRGKGIRGPRLRDEIVPWSLWMREVLRRGLYAISWNMQPRRGAKRT